MSNALIILAQTGKDFSETEFVFPAGFTFFVLAMTLIPLVSLWRVFTKAGQKGWKSLIPIYNTYILLKMISRSGWWIPILMIPLVGGAVSVIMIHDLSKSFRKDIGTSLLLIFVPIIGYPLLAFGNAEYKGPQTRHSPQKAQSL